MASSKLPIIVTCGLPYANGPCHIGHLRTYVPADIYVRGLKKMGEEPIFICGSDSHGTPIVVNAEERGTTPTELVTRYHDHFDDVFKRMEVEFDYFGNTDDPSNHRRTRSIVSALMEEGYVYPQEIPLAYCPSCDRFLPDRYVEGICPYCSSPARGDECDQGCGRHLEPGEIKEPLCKVCGGEAEYRTQRHYFFRLSAFSDFLIEHLEGLGGTANARNYALEWVKQELKDWCITRNLEWGVKFPGQEDLVVYVWVDAPIGYISFTEEWAKWKGESWERYWRQPSRIVHFIGGDIVYHHCIFWPAMLKGAGYTLPSAVVASGMLKIENKTFSKSRGYVVWVIDDYLERGLHPDLLRYYLASYTSHTKELNFSWTIFAEKVNGELVGAMGNFVNRAVTFTSKNFDRSVPEGDLDPEVMAKIGEVLAEVKAALAEYEFKKLADGAMSLADYGNTYFQASEPWKLAKSDRERCGAVLRNCLQIAKALAIVFQPVMPAKMESAWRQLGLEGTAAEALFDDALVPLEAGRELGVPEHIFEKMDEAVVSGLDEVFRERIAAIEAKKDEKKGEEKMNFIKFEDFKSLDIRIGEVKAAERIKGSDKLLRLIVDAGSEERQIVAGIAMTHSPEELVGRKIVVLANLEPAKLFGVESQGMLLAADVGDSAVLLAPEKPVPPGTKIR
ncbi:methionine--tRNA ligase [Methanocrinis sp.]|uniref:methionine--tRNA ligase n=1 Tax=Methanocrinis sp. TaxID=3101522 RepID=UPI003D13B5B3